MTSHYSICSQLVSQLLASGNEITVESVEVKSYSKRLITTKSRDYQSIMLSLSFNPGCLDSLMCKLADCKASEVGIITFNYAMTPELCIIDYPEKFRVLCESTLKNNFGAHKMPKGYAAREKDSMEERTIPIKTRLCRTPILVSNPS